MGSCCNGEISKEDEDQAEPILPLLQDHVDINIPSLQTPLVDRRTRRRRLLDFLRARPSVEWLQAPFAMLKKTAATGLSAPTHLRFLRRTNLASLAKACKEYLKNPMHVALLLWLFFVACFLSLLFLLMTGLVDDAFPTDAKRKRWMEICNQVLNMLFTLMSLYEQPNLVHHLAMLCRWNQEDIASLRKLYCKNGMRRPHERTHMTIVVSLLHVSCFAQYALCGLYWAYTSEDRPEFSDDLCEILGVLAPVSAALYTVYSPLGTEYGYHPHTCEEEGTSSRGRTCERGALVLEAEWAGGLFDCGDDLVVANLACFCTCCVFGWNMERLGFGNMYVHTVTFLLLCVAPYWVFGISAHNILSRTIRRTVSTAGMVLSLCGLMYGGYWRIHMRKRLGLPGKGWCCGSRSVTDYVQWMLCWPCALAQEVRTGNVYDYDAEEGSVYRKGVGSVEACEGDSGASGLPGCVREDGAMVAPIQPVIVLVDDGSVDSGSGVTGVIQGISDDTRDKECFIPG